MEQQLENCGCFSRGAGEVFLRRSEMAWMVRVVEADKVTAGGGSGLDFFFSFLGAFGL